MNVLLLKFFCLISMWIVPDETIPVHRLISVPKDPSVTTRFFASNLMALLDQPDADTLIMEMVTCPLSHDGLSGSDAMPMLDGFQHEAVFAYDASGVKLTGASRAALPCPPHCGGGKFSITLAEFLTYFP